VTRTRGPRRPSRRITIRDVAAAAGVSITTVSHALNGKAGVDPATRERVAAAAERLGYRPSRAARALRSGRTGTIALLLPALDEEPIDVEMLSLDYYMQLATAAARAAFERAHPLLLTPPVTTEAELRELGIDGAVLCDPAARDVRIDMLDALGVPVVTVERDAGRPETRWYVRSDNEANTHALLDHLRDAGAERVALLAPEADWAWAQECTTAYRDWCAGRGLAPLLEPTGLRALERSAHAAAGRLLDRPDRPDAIVALAERHATGVLRAARERGLSVPGDLRIAAGIDSHQSREGEPGITAIDLRPSLQGAAAAEMLIARVRGEEPPAPVTTPAQLHVRASTAAASPRR